MTLRSRTKRIACLTYRKFPGEDWPETEFHEHKVALVTGHVVTMELAERGTLLSGKVWVREFRKLTQSGHQTAIISTDFTRELTSSAAAMFARWSQENFFKYMREHYNIDRLVDYSTENIPESTRVVNPQYREVEGEVRKLSAQLGRKRCECDAIVLCDDIAPDTVAAYEIKKQTLREEIESMEQTLTDQKACRRELPKHVMLSDLPKEDQFRQLGMKSKYFLDTIKLIAYRAETAMVHIVRKTMRRQDEARRLLRSLYDTDADILPDYEKNRLVVRLHQPANQCSAVTMNNLCEELNTTGTKFPGTNLTMIYELVS